MTLKLIDYNTAVLSKEKGFDWKCLSYYTIHHVCDKTPELHNSFNRHTNNYNGDEFTDQSYSAPEQVLLQQWLREVHKIDIVIYPIKESVNGVDIEQKNIEYSYTIYEKGLFVYFNLTYPYTYEEALEEALINGLNLVK